MPSTARNNRSLSWRGISDMAARMAMFFVLIAVASLPRVAAAESIFSGPDEVADFVNARIERSQVGPVGERSAPDTLTSNTHSLLFIPKIAEFIPPLLPSTDHDI
jgi:hypothetical protein